MNRRTILVAGLAAVLPLRRTHAEARPFRRGSWQQLRAEHQGRPAIVHFWGLTCAPCLVELPKWGAFRRDHPDADLVLVAADPIPQQTEALSEMLAKAGLQGVESWWFQDRFTERLFWEVDRSWQGELPYTVLLAADGSATGEAGEIGDFGRLDRWLQDPVARRT
ncbi:MAG: TlpA family protein disulfide reductase [Proteobacteria bacterium]|nr:TlpA family protein disulfide reductase [Pseudomonadota bacterium]